MKEKGFARILIILIVLVTISGIYYISTKRENISNHKQTPTATLSPSLEYATSSLKISPEITNNWQIYKNKDYNFSFKYPSEYKFFNERVNKDGSLTVIYRHKNFGEPLSQHPNGFNETRTIQISLVKSSLTLEEFVSKELGLEKLVYGKYPVGTFGNDPKSTLYYLVEIGSKNINEIKFIYYNYAGAAAGNWGYVSDGLNSQTIATLYWSYPDYFDESYVDPILSSFEFTQ